MTAAAGVLAAGVQMAGAQSGSWLAGECGAELGLRLAVSPELNSSSAAAAPAPEAEFRVRTGGAMLSFQPRETSARQPEGGDDNVALAKKLSNPVASMVSVPFQLNFDNGYGPNDADRLTLNIQPVIPFSISDDWNLIVRTIVPLIYQESPAPGVSSESELGDVTQSFFFSPKEAVGGWILAVGPVALWPTGTEPRLRSEQLGLGPTALALRQENGWTYGALANHIWGVTDSDDHADVNATFVQPFVSYTFATATSLTLNSESTYDWTREEWTVPVNLLVGQIMTMGDQPVQLSVGARYYAEAPDGGPEWGLRFGFTLLFPR